MLSVIGLLILFVLLMGIMNMLGGRFEAVDPYFPLDGRLFFRCIMPGICSGAMAMASGLSFAESLYALAAVGVGSALWYAPGWSFDEITGAWSPEKYPSFMRKTALWIFPDTTSPSQNKRRGTLLKSIRGLYDAITFVGLYPLNHAAPAFAAASALMGPIYWACGRLFPYSAPVLKAEFFEGCLRGILIGSVILGGVAWGTQ